MHTIHTHIIIRIPHRQAKIITHIHTSIIHENAA